MNKLLQTISYISQNLLRYLLISIFYLYSQVAIAGTDVTAVYSGDLNYSGPADQLKLGEQIGPTWIADGNQQRMCAPGAQVIYTAYISPIAQPSGLTTTIDGITYVVFDTLSPGIGWVMSIKDRNANNYSPLLNTENQWYPAPGTETNNRVTIGGDVKLTFIKTATHLTTGVITIPAQNVAKISCYGKNGEVLDSALIKIPATTANVTARGCTVESPSNTVIYMGNFNGLDFPSIGSTSGNQSHTISLLCDPSVILKATVSDQSNTSNYTNVVSLTADSTASGLGLQVFYNGSSNPLNLGADNSSSGATNQFDITTIGNSNQIVNVPLSFKYIRTNTVTSGTANALVGVTFSYQ